MSAIHAPEPVLLEPVGRLRRRPPIPVPAWIGGTIVLFWLVIAVIGPLIAPHDIGKVIDEDGFGSMSRTMLFGSDYLGRDVFSRILVGTRTTVGVALAATLLAIAIGGSLGMMAAVVGGWVDAWLSRFLDAVISIPSLMFGLVAVAALGASIPVLIGTAAVIYLPGAFRIWRSVAVNVNTMDFVQVARARGESTGYLVREEILPNILGPVLTDFGLRFVFVVLLLSSLSFLGLGIQPPDADWGSLVRENIGGLSYGAAAVIMPAAALATLTVGVNLLVDNLPGRGRR
jgi:peptide/nickel transport system permease protein